MPDKEKLGIFFGCTTTGAPHLLEGLEDFLRNAGLDFVPLGKDLCCGVPLELSGHHEEARKFTKKVAEELKSSGITKLVTSCPHCFLMFSAEFPAKFGIVLPFQIQHFVQFADDLLKQGRIKLKKTKNLRILYHDPCAIGRQGPGLYDEPRRVLSSCVQVIEADRNKVLGTCCGGGGLLRASLPKLAVAAAKRKIKDDVIPKEVAIIVTSCPFCTLNLSDGAAELDELKIDVFDLPMFLSEHMEKGKS